MFFNIFLETIYLSLLKLLKIHYKSGICCCFKLFWWTNCRMNTEVKRES